jgi:hypothetical protein
MKIKKTNTTTYHPQTNAQAEVCDKTIAACLKTQVPCIGNNPGNNTLLQ